MLEAIGLSKSYGSVSAVRDGVERGRKPWYEDWLELYWWPWWRYLLRHRF